MPEMRVCRRCGTVAPGYAGQCPECRTFTGAGRVVLRIVPPVLIVTAVAAWAILGRGKGGGDPRLAANVQVTPGNFGLSPNQQGTDAQATIDNKNSVPVDVTIVVKGIDYGDNVAIERTIGPIRRVAPGTTVPVRTHFTTAPLKAVTFEAIRVEAEAPPED